jgi:hypothetical protein
MIQRIQTIWLFLAAVCIFLTMNFSTYVGADASAVMQMIKGTSNKFLVITTSMVGVVSKITLVALLIEFVLAFLYYREIIKLTGNGAFAITAILHIAVVIFLLLAVRSINNDEKLIKDSSRLR